jgi:hypothetical protein
VEQQYENRMLKNLNDEQNKWLQLLPEKVLVRE